MGARARTFLPKTPVRNHIASRHATIRIFINTGAMARTNPPVCRTRILALSSRPSLSHSPHRTSMECHAVSACLRARWLKIRIVHFPRSYRSTNYYPRRVPDKDSLANCWPRDGGRVNAELTCRRFMAVVSFFARVARFALSRYLQVFTVMRGARILIARDYPILGHAAIRKRVHSAPGDRCLSANE